MLSEHQMQIIQDKNINCGKIHWQNLKLCLKLGLQLKKIHRILEFKQERVLKPYTDLNTVLHREAENDGNKIKKTKCYIKKQCYISQFDRKFNEQGWCKNCDYQKTILKVVI